MNANTVRIEPHMLSEVALTGLLEEYASRDGTDYGEHEVPLATKVKHLRALVQRGEAVIVVDTEEETFTLVKCDELEG